MQLSISEGVIEKALNKHSIPSEVVQQSLVRALDPMLITRNTSPEGRTDVLMYPGTINRGKPIALAVELNKTRQRLIVSELASVHQKTRFNEDFDNWNQNGLVLFVHPENGKDWLRELTGRQLPEVMNQSCKIFTPLGQKVNPRAGDHPKGSSVSDARQRVEVAMLAGRSPSQSDMDLLREDEQDRQSAARATTAPFFDWINSETGSDARVNVSDELPFGNGQYDAGNNTVTVSRASVDAMLGDGSPEHALGLIYTLAHEATHNVLSRLEIQDPERLTNLVRMGMTFPRTCGAG
ncbi:MAG TPA: hypothetical protein VIM48_04555 [Chthoniobacterales bacterium]